MKFQLPSLGTAQAGIIPTAKTPAQYASLMLGVNDSLTRIFDGMIGLEEQFADSHQIANYIDNIDLATVAIEETKGAAFALGLVAGDQQIQGMVACENYSFSPSTQVERERVAHIAVEGLGEKMKAGYRAVIQFFKNLWEKFTNFLKNLFDGNRRLRSALETQKSRIKGMSSPSIDGKATTTAVPYAKFTGVMTTLKTLATELSSGKLANKGVVETALAEGVKTKSSSLRAALEPKSGTLASLGYTVGNVQNLLDIGLDALSQVDALKVMEGQLKKVKDEGIAKANEALSTLDVAAANAGKNAKGVAAGQKDQKKKLNDEIKGLQKASEAISAGVSGAARAAILVANTAQKLAKMVKSAA